ncbi:uncharacterized protein LOC111388090 [Olea europaea var. sylvestris]|uniref:uncharacterized protein LOC111388090 n=1 Tax=Olea europaea var. sylvestris TaxID=158386 RepID=UPI000C1D4C06|nr:uncharacterized protein LOC111388090 [Olea europaea var. sylvestris]
MSTSIKLGHDPIGKSIDPSLYRSIIASLLYLTATRPDIAFSVGVCAKFQVNPKESHLSASDVSLGTLILIWPATPMLIGLVMLMVERALLEVVSTLMLSDYGISQGTMTLVETGVVFLDHISTKNQLADLFTKLLDRMRFKLLRKDVGVCVPL